MTGTIVHHYFSGYGGGRKAVLPGVAAMETVRVNHSFMLDPNAGLGKTVGNPVYEDQMEGVAIFAKDHSLFLFNAILNAQHEFLKIFAGHYVEAHQEACKFVDAVYGVDIPRARIWSLPAAAVIRKISMSTSCKKLWITPGVLCAKAV